MKSPTEKYIDEMKELLAIYSSPEAEKLMKEITKQINEFVEKKLEELKKDGT